MKLPKEYNDVEELVEDINTALYAAMNSQDYISPMVTSRDDVVLLSFGFKFGSGPEVMWRVDSDGTEWSVDLSSNYAKFSRNREDLGTMNYDDMVSTFRRPSNE